MQQVACDQARWHLRGWKVIAKHGMLTGFQCQDFNSNDEAEHVTIEGKGRQLEETLIG